MILKGEAGAAAAPDVRRMMKKLCKARQLSSMLPRRYMRIMLHIFNQHTRKSTAESHMLYVLTRYSSAHSLDT